MKQTVVGDDAVIFECELPDPRDKVWRALTERDLLARWLSPNDLRLEVGARFQLRPASMPTPTGAGATSAARPTESKPTGAKPAEAGPAEAGPAEARPIEAGPTEARPAESSPVGASPTKSAPLTRATLGAVVDCEVLAVDPGRTLSWRQREPADSFYVESVVRFDLADLPNGGTRLRVVHDGFTTVARKPTVVSFRPRTKPAITNCLLRMVA